MNLYGLVDAGVEVVNHASATGGTVTRLTSGGMNTSRWGIRGSEDLGGGLKAVFQLESGIFIDNGTVDTPSSVPSGLFRRQSYVGLPAVAQLSDITKVDAPDTFERPIYAGNAIAVQQSADPVKVITVRTTGFDAAPATGGSAAVETIAAVGDSGKSAFVGRELTKSDRPELTAAKIIVSGGRALGSAEKFTEVLTPLADKLGWRLT